MKKTILIAAMAAITLGANAQLRVANSGQAHWEWAASPSRPENTHRLCIVNCALYGRLGEPRPPSVIFYFDVSGNIFKFAG